MKLETLVKRRFYWSAPCTCCGSRVRWSVPVISDELSQQWELDPQHRRLFDEREGIQCARCHANWRVRHLAEVLLADINARTGYQYKTVSSLVHDHAIDDLMLAEINELPGLHRYLSRLPNLAYSEYGGENSQDLMALSYRDASFDYVLTSDTLEHIPDFDLALSEIRRVLKPGGKHIFTIPVIWDRPTRQRAEALNGTITNRLPPSHHGDPKSSPDDYLVFNEFGGDVVQRIGRAGYSVTLAREPRNELVVTIVAMKAGD